MSRALFRPVFLSLAAIAALLAACAGGGSTSGTPTKEPITIGSFYDGSGATSAVGVPHRQGFDDYIRLVNKRGGVDGHPINTVVIDMGYEVPKGIEGYERMKREGVVAISMWATPLVAALQERAVADHIPLIHPGFGVGAALLGEKFPYLFPTTGSYWTQTAGAVKFILDKWKEEGRPGKPKIAFIFQDNPAGREPLDLLNEIQRKEGFELQTWAVPLPGLDVSAQVTDAVQRFRADWIICHLFSRSPAPFARAVKDQGFPMNRVVGLWGCFPPEQLTGVGGTAAVEGMYGVSFHGFGPDLPIANDIRQLYQEEGKTPPPAFQDTVFYWHGVMAAALTVKGVEQALKSEGWPLNGEKVKRGLEKLSGEIFDLASVKMSPQDHEGGGYVKVFQAKGGKWQPVTDWYNAYREEVLAVATKVAGG
jgi:branched-chain amino acid transport system substrate-binding protein